MILNYLLRYFDKKNMIKNCFLLIAKEYNKAKYFFLLYSGICWIQMNSTMIHIRELRSTINYFSLVCARVVVF